MVGHVWNQDKERFLKFDMKRDYIREMTQALCISMQDRYYYAEAHHDGTHTDNIKAHLNDLALERGIDISVVGWHGRKGEKEDNTVMGTAVAFLTIEAVCPILIVKDHIDRSKKVNNAYSHCLCFDGSEQSVKSLYLIRKVIWPQDKLVIIICD